MLALLASHLSEHQFVDQLEVGILHNVNNPAELELHSTLL